MHDTASLPSSSLPAPLYTQIKEALRARILDGSYAIFDRMPSESELMKRFSVSRVTARQAVSQLCQEGLVFKVQGKGSYVSRPQVSQSLTVLQGLGEAVRESGHVASSRLLGSRFFAPDDTLRARLQIAPPGRVGEIRRVRYLDGAPVSLDISYFREATAEALLAHDLGTRDIFAILENDLQCPLGHAELDIGAVAADVDAAHALEILPGSPILRMDRLTFDRDGRPLDYEHLYCRGDQWRYRLRIERHGAHGGGVS